MHARGFVVLAAAALLACGAQGARPATGRMVDPTEPIHEGERIDSFVVDRHDGQGQVRIPGGKLTLVDFFATWCPSSAKWLPKIEALHERYRDQGLVVVGVSQDDENPADDDPGITAFAKAHGATFPIVWDRRHVLGEAIRPPHWQSIVIVDRSGVVRFTHVGTYPGAEVPVEEKVRALLAATE